MIPLDVILGLLIIPATLIAIVQLNKTLYFGLTALCLYHVFSASFAAYVHGTIFGISMPWITSDHVTVFRYTTWGCMAFLVGVHLAMRRNRLIAKRKIEVFGRRPELCNNARWLNLRFSWFLFLIGVSASIVEIFVYNVPTIRTAIHALSSFLTFGLLMLLACSIKRGKAKYLLIGVCIYFLLSLSHAVRSGHSPLTASLAIPVIAILAWFNGLNFRTPMVLLLGFFILSPLMQGWMHTRRVIREGDLQSMEIVDRVTTFVPLLIDSSFEHAFDTADLHDRIIERVDMSEILSQQVRHQPMIQPYANGSTFIDAFIALIPRFLWAEKPIIAGGSQFVTMYTGMIRTANDTTSIGLPYQFELYANGGPYFVVFGLFVIGWILGYLESSLFLLDNNLAVLMAKIAAVMTLSDGGQRMDVVIPSLLAGVITYFFFGYWLQKTYPVFVFDLLNPSGSISDQRIRPVFKPEKSLDNG